MSLKDLISADMALFFDSADFAEEHRINNYKKLVIVDNDRLIKRSKAEFEGTSAGELLFFIREADLPKRPEEGDIMRFDSRTMQVVDCREVDGMYEIILTQNR